MFVPFCGLNGTGSYSVLIGNRLPDASSSNKYIAHVVSLEGWEAYLPGTERMQTFETGQAARLISLYSWTFTSTNEGPNFQQLIDQLSVGGLCLTLNNSWDNPTSAQAEVVARYNNGYVALNYNTRIGLNNFAWYRGPFSPTPPLMIQNTLPVFLGSGAPFTNADDAIIYDAAHGVFDLSYAVAFETGRVVTLASKSASLAIWKWKKDAVKLLQILNNLVAEAENSGTVTPLSKRKKAAAATKDNCIDWEDIKRKLKDTHAGPKAFMHYVAGPFGEHFTARKRGIPNAAINICDPSKLSSHNDANKSAKYLPGLLSHEELNELAESGKDPYVYIIEKLNKNIQTTI